MMPRYAPLLALLALPAAAEEALVDYVVENGASIPAPLVAHGGGPADGRAVFDRAGCAACHRAPEGERETAEGPDLAGVGARLTEGEIRLTIVDPAILSPETEMPAYYAVGRPGEIPDDLVGRTRLSAEEVELLVSWLVTLRD